MLVPISKCVERTDPATYGRLASKMSRFSFKEIDAKRKEKQELDTGMFDTHAHIHHLTARLGAHYIKKTLTEHVTAIRKDFPEQAHERELLTLAYSHILGFTPKRSALDTGVDLTTKDAVLADALITELRQVVEDAEFIVSGNTFFVIGNQGLLVYHVITKVGGEAIYRHDLLCTDSVVEEYYHQLLAHLTVPIHGW